MGVDAEVVRISRSRGNWFSWLLCMRCDLCCGAGWCALSSWNGEGGVHHSRDKEGGVVMVVSPVVMVMVVGMFVAMGVISFRVKEAETSGGKCGVVFLSVLVIGTLVAVGFWSSVLHPSGVAPGGSAGGMSVVGGPSLSASYIDGVLKDAGSPAVGLGGRLSALSEQYHIDDAYALATFRKESTYGTAGMATVTHSLGNIICAGYPTCYGRFRSYQTWDQGAEDFYRLVAREYVGRGLSTVEAIIPVYAPSVENNTQQYIGDIRSFMMAFRSGR